MRPSLSISMILRDEAATLPGCLSCFWEVADEICVVDTGSTDDTATIARGRGCMVQAFTWCDDFAAARNASLAMCTSDWVLVVDADERIASQDVQALRELLQSPKDRCYRFVTRTYTNDSAFAEFCSSSPKDEMSRSRLGWFPSSKVRLFPNGLGIAFEGRIHELVNASASQKGLAIDECAIPIHHYPVMESEGDVSRKGVLYKRLCEMKVEDLPRDPKAHSELGDILLSLGEHRQAIQAFRNSLALYPQNAQVLSDLGAVLHLHGQHEEAERSLRLAVKVDEQHADAWRNLGVVLSESRRWEGARTCFERAVFLRAGWSEGLRCLSVALEHCGDVEDAAEAAEQALTANPASRPCADRFVECMVALQRVEAGLKVVKALELSAGLTAALEEARAQLVDA